MDAFGVHKDYRFQMWDWVGGRYSIWSSIGVSLAIAIGKTNFEQFLAGAHAMDEHFRSTEWADNLPVLMGLLGVWNINFRKLPTLAVLPYDDRLKRLSAYLQQLEMGEQRQVCHAGGRAHGVGDGRGDLGRAGQQCPAFVLPVTASGHHACSAGFHSPRELLLW